LFDCNRNISKRYPAPRGHGIFPADAPEGSHAASREAAIVGFPGVVAKPTGARPQIRLSTFAPAAE